MRESQIERETCNGTDQGEDEESYSDPASSTGYGTRRIVVECGECTMGRNAR